MNEKSTSVAPKLSTQQTQSIESELTMKMSSVREVFRLPTIPV